MEKESFEAQERKLTREEELVLESDKMQRATSEAFDRLLDVDLLDAGKLSELTQKAYLEDNHEKISDFLNQNSEKLSEEAKFYLNASLHNFRINAELKKIRGE